MAKRKDSVALFEVIKAQKSREKAAAAAANPESAQPAPLRTPKWWFKRSPGSQPPQQITGPDPFAAPALPPPAQAPMPMSSGSGEYSPDVDPTMSRSAAALVQRVVPAASPERVTIPGGVDPFGLDPSPAQAAPTRRPAARSWFGFGPARKIGIDPDRKEVTVRLRYTTAIIAGFAVCVVIGLAYLSGRSSNRASAGANGITSEQVRRGPILAGVLDVQPERSTISEEGAAPTTTTPEPPNDVRVAPPLPEPQSAGNEAPRGGSGGPTEGAVVDNPPPAMAVTGAIATDLPRHNGLNYVVVQTYPAKKDAEAAKEALLAAGIPCTVDRPPTGWGDQKLWAVIGNYGFPRTNTMPEYKRYVEQIKAVGKNFAGKSKYRSFDPSPVKWKDS
jgi:hypothetical protein